MGPFTFNAIIGQAGNYQFPLKLGVPYFLNSYDNQVACAASATTAVPTGVKCYYYGPTKVGALTNWYGPSVSGQVGGVV